ncbi:hypothetical protein PMAYCL1PPCAC_12970, partial [Pristionchus mayeri]
MATVIIQMYKYYNFKNHMLYSSLALSARASSKRSLPNSLRLASILSPSIVINVITCSDRFTCSFPTITDTFPSGFSISFFVPFNFSLRKDNNRRRSSLLISLLFSTPSTRPLLCALAMSEDTVAAIFRSIEQSADNRRALEIASQSTSSCVSFIAVAGGIS